MEQSGNTLLKSRKNKIKEVMVVFFFRFYGSGQANETVSWFITASCGDGCHCS